MVEDFLDPYFIELYRLTGEPLVDFFLGTFFLACLSVLIGEFTISVVYRLNKGYYDRLNAEVFEKNNLAIEALRSRNKEAYKKYNKLANDAFGKVFFNQFGLSAASLWPILFVLAWMQSRFMGIEFPLFGITVNYFLIFLLMYILARILFKNIRHKLPYFKNIHKMLQEYDREKNRMLDITDMMEGRAVEKGRPYKIS